MAKRNSLAIDPDLYKVAGAFVAVMLAGLLLDYVVFVVFEFCALFVGLYLVARPGDKKEILRMQLLYVTIWGAILLLAKGYIVYQTMNASGIIGGVKISRHFSYALAASANDKILWALALLPLAVAMDIGKNWIQHSRDSDNDRSLEQITQRQNRSKF